MRLGKTVFRILLAAVIVLGATVSPASAASLFAPPKWSVHTSTGTPASGWKLYFYDAGTDTPRDTYTTAGQTVANTNPVVLDSRGEAVIYLNGAYKVKLKDASDVVIWTVDNYGESSSSVVDQPGLSIVPNGSFEIDVDTNGVPDGWATSPYTGGTIARVSSAQLMGTYAEKFTSTGSGGGVLTSSAFAEVSPSNNYVIGFSLISSVANVRNVVAINWYTAAEAFISTSTVYDNSTTNPTSWTKYLEPVSAPATARYAKLVLTGCHSSVATSGNTHFDDIRLFPVESPSSAFNLVTTSVTYVSASSFSVDSAYSGNFAIGQKVWVDQATDVVGTVVSATTVGATTTVVLGKIVLYSDNLNTSTVTNNIVAVYSSVLAPLSNPVPSYYRNFIVNGGMSIDQRNNGASQTITADGALHYTIDRWYAHVTGANATGQRVAGSVQSQYRYQFTGAASVTAINFGTRLEAADTYRLNGQTAVLSVDLSNSLLTSVTWTAYYANSTDTFGTIAAPTRTQIATGTFTVSPTLTRYSTQISIPTAATTGIEIVLSVGAQVSGTFVIGAVQLEEGTIPTQFEFVSRQSVFDRCLRYYWRHTNSGNDTLGAGFITNNTSVSYIHVKFPVPMRVAPAFAVSNVAHFVIMNLAAQTATTNVTAANISTEVATISATTAALTAGQGCILQSTTASSWMEFSSEL